MLRRSVLTLATSKVAISASISGGVGAIEAEIGYANEQSMSIAEQISMTIPAHTTLNLRVRCSNTTWYLKYSGFLGTSTGTGTSKVPAGLCISTASDAPPPPP